MFSAVSEWIMPAIILYVVIDGLVNRVDIYSEFIKGAAQGFKVVYEIAPTIVGLLVAVGILRNSGIFEMLEKLDMAGFSEIIPTEVIPVVFVKLFSSSAATALVLDIFKTSGPDSEIGRMVSVICSCTETIFYVVSIYFMSIKIKKTKWTLPGALITSIVGVAASIILVKMIW